MTTTPATEAVFIEKGESFVGAPKGLKLNDLNANIRSVGLHGSLTIKLTVFGRYYLRNSITNVERTVDIVEPWGWRIQRRVAEERIVEGLDGETIQRKLLARGGQ